MFSMTWAASGPQNGFMLSIRSSQILEIIAESASCFDEVRSAAGCPPALGPKCLPRCMAEQDPTPTPITAFISMLSFMQSSLLAQ